MKQKVIKMGNSLAVTIPALFVKNLGIMAGNEVEVKIIPEKGKVIYTFSGIYQLPLTSSIKRK